MSPEVSLRVESKGSIEYFTVNLNNDTSFNPETFDNLARLIDPHIEASYLKFIVAGGLMYVFEDTTDQQKLETHSHLGVYNSVVASQLKNGESIQCAGKIKIDHEKGVRFLSLGSHTLTKAEMLSFMDSYRYNERVLAPLLKDSFTF